MKKFRLSKLAMLGIASGFLVSAEASALTSVAQTTTVLAKMNLYDRAEGGMSSGKKDRQKMPSKCIAEADAPKKSSKAIPDTKAADDKASSDASYDPNSENEGYHLMTEDELKALLNRKTSELYDSLDPQGKDLALKVASGRCNNTNECKGLNACETPDNKCAGLGACKAKGKCAFSDKNLAVKLVAKKMAEKRMKTMQKN